MQTVDRVRGAITSIKKGRKKLTISAIAERAGIARKTIYNRPDLKLLCDQAIELQKQEELTEGDNKKSKSEREKPLTGYKLLEQRYRKLKDILEKEQEKNMKLLHNNKVLVLEKEQLESKILMLEKRIEQLNKDKIKPLR